MEQNQRWRSPQQGWQNPRFRGSPGHSPGRYQSPRGQNFRPYFNRNGSPYDRGFHHQSPQQYGSPYHRPRGWFPRNSSPRFSHDRSFSSPGGFKEGRHSDRDNIEIWVSPEMWGDPWEELRSDSSPKISVSLIEDEQMRGVETEEIQRAEAETNPNTVDDTITDQPTSSSTCQDDAEIPIDDEDET